MPIHDAHYDDLIRSILEYGAIVWTPANTIDNSRSIDSVQNRFLSFAVYRTNIAHQSLKYTSILENYSTLNRYPNVFSCRFIWGLIDGIIEAPTLLERP